MSALDTLRDAALAAAYTNAGPSDISTKDYAVLVERAAESVKAEIERLKEANAYWVSKKNAEIARLRNGLQIIAGRSYPAVYIGEAKDGTKMYGGSDDASRFARALLDEDNET